MREALVGARCTASGANDLLRGWAARLHSQQQIINDRFAHFTQIVRGESELLRLGVHGGLKREHFCVIKHVRGVFKGFQQRNPALTRNTFKWLLFSPQSAKVAAPIVSAEGISYGIACSFGTTKKSCQSRFQAWGWQLYAGWNPRRSNSAGTRPPTYSRHKAQTADTKKRRLIV